MNWGCNIVDYKLFLQHSGKSQLVAFFRRYETSMKRRKKFITPEEFFNLEIEEDKKRFEKSMEKVSKVVEEDKESTSQSLKEVGK